MDEAIGRDALHELLDKFGVGERAPYIAIDEGANLDTVPIQKIKKLTASVWSPDESELDQRRWIPEGIYDVDRYYQVRIIQSDVITIAHFLDESDAREAVRRIYEALERQESLTVGVNEGVVSIVENDRFVPDPYKGNRCELCGKEDIRLAWERDNNLGVCIPCDEDYHE